MSNICVDVLSLIISQTNNYYCTIVCKDWYNAVLQNSVICKDCNKIVKMYDTDLWVSDDKDSFCHGYYGSLEDYNCLKHMINYTYKFLTKIDRFSTGLILYVIGKCYNREITFMLEQPKAKKMFEFCVNKSENMMLHIIKKYHEGLFYVKNQTEKICLQVVKNNGLALKYVLNQTENICLEAVKNNGLALEYVLNQTENICLEAVKQDGDSLQYVKNQTENICIEAINKRVRYFRYILNPTARMYIHIYKIDSRYCKEMLDNMK
jgi:hypothetical protein